MAHQYRSRSSAPLRLDSRAIGSANAGMHEVRSSASINKDSWVGSNAVPAHESSGSSRSAHVPPAFEVKWHVSQRACLSSAFLLLRRTFMAVVNMPLAKQSAAVLHYYRALMLSTRRSSTSAKVSRLLQLLPQQRSSLALRPVPLTPASTLPRPSASAAAPQPPRRSTWTSTATPPQVSTQQHHITACNAAPDDS